MFGFKKKVTLKNTDSLEVCLQKCLDSKKIVFTEKDVKATNKHYNFCFNSGKEEEWKKQVLEMHPNIHTPEELTYATHIADAVGLVYDSVAVNLTHIANAIYKGGFQYSFNKTSFEKELLERYNNGDNMLELAIWTYHKTNTILKEIIKWDTDFAQVNNIFLAQIAAEFQLKSANKIFEALCKFMNCTKEQHLKMEQDFCNRAIFLKLPNILEAVFCNKKMAKEAIGEMIMNRVSKIGAGEQILLTSKAWKQVFLNGYDAGFAWSRDTEEDNA